MNIRRPRVAARAFVLALQAGASVAVLAAAAPAVAAELPASDGATLDTVVVTAEKRSERLQDIPAAVSVVGGDQLVSLGVSSTRDLLQQLPGVDLVSSGPTFLQDVSMRGQGAGRNGFSETSTGLYENGAYIAGGGFNGRQLSEMNLFDVDRLEVLHGPQGALYGRNSVGGAINVIEHQPTGSFSALEQFKYGDKNTYGGQGVVNAPITTGLGELDVRVGGFYTAQNGGFMSNLTTGDAIDAYHSWGVRTGFLARPTHGGKLYVQLEYYDIRQGSFGTLGYVPVYAATTSAFTKGATLDPGPYTRSNMNREGRSKAPDFSAYVGFDQATDAGDLSVKLYNRDRNAGRYNEDYDHYLGLSGFASRAAGSVTAPTDLSQFQYEDYHLYDGQVTFAAHQTGRWKWLVGGEALHFSDAVHQGMANCAAYDPAPKTAAAMATYQGNGAGGCVAGLAPSSAAYPVSSQYTADVAVLNAIRGQMSDLRYLSKLTSYAAFGTLTYDLTPQVALGFEGRVTTDRANFSFQQYSQDPLAWFGAGAAPAGFLAPLAGEYCSPAIVAAGQCTGATGGPYQSGPLSHRWTEVLPGASLNWRPSSRQILYVRFATGYRPGGYNNPLTAVQPLYQPEYARSVETGWKGDVFGLFHAEADIYYQATRHVQLVQYSTTAAGGYVLQNVGDDHVYGIEANAHREFRGVGPGVLKLSVSLSSNTGAFEGGATITEKAPYGPLSLAGLRTPYTNDIQGSIDAAYTLPLNGQLSLKLEGTYGFARGGVQQYSAASGVLTPVPFPTRNLLDLHLTLASTRGWEISAYGKNITDDRYLTSTVGSAQFWSQPATWGLTVTARQ
ncbi:TonB-dependent receptor [Caulobacter sp. KR2-114]|uniref:TonB-dependent receptor n=1 Tax=Caulobacter sp. KR2-114 TaxID=3400912 RepID=UPI003C0CB0A8